MWTHPYWFNARHVAAFLWLAFAVGSYIAAVVLIGLDMRRNLRDIRRRETEQRIAARKGEP